MNNLFNTVFLVLLLLITKTISAEVNIIKDLASIEVPHGNKMIIVTRDQNNKAIIKGDFAQTSRNCPPFCIQPMVVAPGVKTIGEKELILFMMNNLKDKTGILIDARTPDWFKKGTIPGSINIPYTNLNRRAGADEFEIDDAFALLGVEKDEKEKWDFFDTKTLVLWCNGSWCGQSPAAIQGLLEQGYPAEKILYYRGGMQSWLMLGFNIVKE
jgi:rhodanese-related sulfurtransferase